MSKAAEFLTNSANRAVTTFNPCGASAGWSFDLRSHSGSPWARPVCLTLIGFLFLQAEIQSREAPSAGRSA